MSINSISSNYFIVFIPTCIHHAHCSISCTSKSFYCQIMYISYTTGMLVLLVLKCLLLIHTWHRWYYATIVLVLIKH